MTVKKIVIYSLNLVIIAGLVAFTGLQLTQNQPEEGEVTFVTKENNQAIKFSVIEVAYFVYAAENGDVDTVNKFIELGIDVNQRDHNEDTAIMGAALNGHKDIIRILLANKADPKIKNRDGYNALDFSQIHERQGTLALLESGEVNSRLLSSVEE